MTIMVRSCGVPIFRVNKYLTNPLVVFIYCNVRRLIVIFNAVLKSKQSYMDTAGFIALGKR